MRIVSLGVMSALFWTGVAVAQTDAQDGANAVASAGPRANASAGVVAGRPNGEGRSDSGGQAHDVAAAVAVARPD